MAIDINSRLDCEDLERRILETLRVSGFDTNDIKTKPSEFREDDAYIFEGLSKAVMSRQTDWDKVKEALPALKEALFDYDICKIAVLTNADVDKIFEEKLKGKTKIYLLRRKLKECKNNAKVFQDIRKGHGSVWKFIENSLIKNEYDGSLKCYIRPKDDVLITYFTRTDGQFKLSGVRSTICREFFNNIGIDELKPDVHVIRVFGSIGIKGMRSQDPKKAREEGKENNADVRQIGITMAETLGKPRKYVDSLLWNFGRSICKKTSPTCTSCKLKTEIPAFCGGLPDWDGRMIKDISSIPGKETTTCIAVTPAKKPEKDKCCIEVKESEETQIAKLPISSAPLNKADHLRKIKGIKHHLAADYITDLEEKSLFLRTRDTTIHEWGPYIAGVNLSKTQPTFGRSDIIEELHRLIPEIYGQMYVKETTIIPSDVIATPLESGKNYTHGFPCLEKTEWNQYQFVGFKEGIRKRYGNDILKKRLSES
jgi:endonuclease III